MPAAVSIDVPIERPSRTSKRTGIRNLESAATGGTGESAGPLCVAVSSDELGRRRRSMTSRTYVSKIVALPTESKEVKETGRRWRHYAGPTLIRRGGRLSIVVPPVPCSTTKRAGFSLSMAAPPEIPAENATFTAAPLWSLQRTPGADQRNAGGHLYQVYAGPSSSSFSSSSSSPSSHSSSPSSSSSYLFRRLFPFVSFPSRAKRNASAVQWFITERWPKHDPLSIMYRSFYSFIFFVSHSISSPFIKCHIFRIKISIMVFYSFKTVYCILRKFRTAKSDIKFNRVLQEMIKLTFIS